VGTAKTTYDSRADDKRQHPPASKKRRFELAAFAIAIICFMELFAIHAGMDGTTFGIACGAIGALAGAGIAYKIGRKE